MGGVWEGGHELASTTKLKLKEARNLKKIYQIDSMLNIVGIWDNAVQAANHYEVKSEKILACCNRNSSAKTFLGFFWVFVEDIDCGNIDTSYFILKSRKRKILQFTPDGTLVKVWDSARDTRSEGFESSNVLEVCHHNMQSYMGYIWCFEGEELPDFSNVKVYRNKGSISVSQYTLEGKFVKKYKTLREASRAIGQSSLLSQLRKSRYSHGFLWKKDDDALSIEDIVKQYERSLVHKTRPVLQMDINHHVIKRFESVTEAARSVRRATNTISTACRLGSKTAGYYWKLEVPTGKYNILCYDKNGELLKTFSSYKEASAKMLVSITNISSVVNGKSKTAGGYIWKKEEVKTDEQRNDNG